MSLILLTTVTATINLSMALVQFVNPSNFVTLQTTLIFCIKDIKVYQADIPNIHVYSYSTRGNKINVCIEEDREASISISLPICPLVSGDHSPQLTEEDTDSECEEGELC